MHHSLLTSDSQFVSDAVCDALSAAKTSVSNIHSATFVKAARSNLRSSHVSYWDSTFESLQNKFLDIVDLEQACPLWKRLMFGLPESTCHFFSMLVVIHCQHQ